jgi:hypothetical protein
MRKLKVMKRRRKKRKAQENEMIAKKQLMV